MNRAQAILETALLEMISDYNNKVEGVNYVDLRDFEAYVKSKSTVSYEDQIRDLKRKVVAGIESDVQTGYGGDLQHWKDTVCVLPPDVLDTLYQLEGIMPYYDMNETIDAAITQVELSH